MTNTSDYEVKFMVAPAEDETIIDKNLRAVMEETYETEDLAAVAVRNLILNKDYGDGMFIVYKVKPAVLIFGKLTTVTVRLK